MSVVDSRRDRGVADAAARPAEQPVEHSGFFENIMAGMRGAASGPASTRSHQNAAEAPYYDQIVNALNAAGERTADRIEVRPGGWGYRGPKVPVNQYGVGFAPGTPRAFQNPYTGHFSGDDANPIAQAFVGGNPRETQAIWDAVQRVRKRNPGFLKDFPDPNAVTKRAEDDRQRRSEKAAEVYSRASRLGTVGNFVGGAVESLAEPESTIGGGAGAVGKTIGRTILKRSLESGAANLAAGVIATPSMHVDAATIGQKPTIAGDLRNIAQQGLFGTAFGAAHAAAPHLAAPVGRKAAEVVGQSLAHLPGPIRDAALAAAVRAGTVGDRAMVAEARRALNPHTVNSIATPDETAAMHVVERDADVREASPLHPEADGAHQGRLDAVMASLGMDAKPAPVATPAPRQQATAPIPAAEGGGRRPASYVDAVHHAEGTGRNPDSTAEGHFQFTNGTWLEYAPRVTNTAGLSRAEILALRHDRGIAEKAEQLFRGDNARYLRQHGVEDSPGNLSLAHFLGKSDAAKVLRAAPGTPIESLVDRRSYAANQRVLKGKSASQVIAWAHKRIGAATDLPVARADAVPQWDYETDMIPEDVPEVTSRQFRPDDLTTDAPLMQYKSGGDAAGVTDRLAGVEQWNPLLSGKVVVWEGLDGRNVIVDGHQRLGLAQRLAKDDPSIALDAVVMREADGVTPQQARVAGALKNIAEGTGSPIDAARVLREAPDGARMLPPRAANVRAARGLAGLSHEAFGAVLNDVIDPEMASAIGRIAPDQPDRHMALVSLLREAGVTNVGQAETVVRQALADGFGAAQEHQLGMFGADPQQSLYGPSARILEAAKRQLKAEKRSFKTLTEDASRIESAGNVLDRAANEAKVLNSDQAIAILDATAHSAGPVRTALLEAARASLHGDRGGAVRQFLSAVEGIDLRAAARGVEEGDGARRASVEYGSEIDHPEANGDMAGGGREGPSLFDQAISAERTGERFSDPVGEGAKAQVEHLEHDVRADLERADESPQAQRFTYDPYVHGDEAAANRIAVDALNGDIPREQAIGQINDLLASGKIEEGYANVNFSRLGATHGEISAAAVPAKSQAPIDAAEQPTFRLTEDGDEHSAKEVLEAFDHEMAALDAIEACLK